MYKSSPLAIIICLMIGVPSLSQKKFVLSVFTGSGISFFGGSGATSESIFIAGDPIAINKVRDPYGKKSFPNFLAGLQTDIALHCKWSLSVSTQYEQIGGREKVDTILYLGTEKVDGRYKRWYDFISVNPQIGKIVFQKKITVILHTGLDYAFKLTTGNQFDYTEQSGQKHSIGFSGDTPETNDIRFTIGSSINMKKWILDLNYKHGLSNYNKDGSGKAFERILHLRLMYTFLNKKR